MTNAPPAGRSQPPGPDNTPTPTAGSAGSAPVSDWLSPATPNDPAVTDRMWAEIVETLRRQRPDLFAPWFGQLRALDLVGGQLRVVGPDTPRTDWLRRYAVEGFNAAAQAVTGHLIAIEFVTGDQLSVPSSRLTAPPSLLASAPAAATQTPPLLASGIAPDDPFHARLTAYLATPASLSREYTFDNFVTGPSNRFAQAACVAIADQPGTAYNPLFIHGGVGLGKTHLLQAVGHALLARQPDSRILYLTCETFVNDFIDAIATNRLSALRAALRSATVLVIDDVQFLTVGDRSQEEFFHTFNALYQAGSQIILSADVGPDQIAGLEARLVSRFKWGLVVQVEPPAFETRVAILRKKARLRGFDLPENVGRLIADALAANTRQLEGALTTLRHVALLEGRAIDMALARSALRDVLPPPPATPAPPRDLTLSHIVEAVCRHFDVPQRDLTGKRRTRSIALARMIAMYLARRLTPMSLEEIGGWFGGRDHTTVMHAERTIEADRATDPTVANALTRLTSDLGISLDSPPS